MWQIAIFIFIGFLCGWILGKFWNERQARRDKQLALDSLQQNFEKQLANKEEVYNAVSIQQEKMHQNIMQTMQQNFDKTIANMRAEMKAATEDMLKQRQYEFAQSSNQALGQIVNPLRDSIEQIQKAMEDNRSQHSELSGELKANIRAMIEQNEATRRSTEELTRAFKHTNKVQGNWGEMVLCELLEAQGLCRGVHYDTQSVIRDAHGQTVRTEEGSLLKPDVILHLDKQREVVIDSKVSLTAFLDYVNAETEPERQTALNHHIDSIQKHVKELSAKDYSSYIKPPKVKMDYVIMFVPHVSALWTALNAKPDLWRKAMEKNVFIADEQTLFAALRIVSLTWRQIVQQQNHERVFALANEMLDRVGQFMKKYQQIGRLLEQASRAYEDAGKKLEPQGQSILQTCKKLEKLGAKQSDRNPLPQLRDEDSALDAESDKFQDEP
jgi:DNA recombination protein RmuC